MSGRDTAFGAFTCLIAILLGVVYFAAMFGILAGYALLAMEVVVSLGVLVILGIIFWVGYTIATTPSIEEIEKAARKK